MTYTAHFRAAHASQVDWHEAVSEIVQSLGDLNTDHELGFLYISDAYAAWFGDIAEYLKQKTGVPHWVGSVGMGVCGTAREYFDTAAMSVLVTPFASSSFRIVHDFNLETFNEINPLQNRLDLGSPPLVVVHGDPTSQELPRLIELLAAQTGGFLVGGLSSSKVGHAQLADKIVEGGLSGVLLSSAEIPLITGLTQGCSPIGSVHEITEAEQNVLLSLDGKRALDVFCEDIGEELAEDLQRCAGLIFAAIPVEGSDTGDYLVRNLVGIDPQSGAVAIGEYVEAGQRVLFCRRDPASAEKDLRRMARNLKQRAGRKIKAGLYFSCVARGPNQFGPDSRELGIIAEELGVFPLAGFFANGEINYNRLYGFTGVLTLFL